MGFVTDGPLDPRRDATYVPFGPLVADIADDLVRSGLVAVVGPARSGKGTLLRALHEEWNALGGAWQPVRLSEPVRADEPGRARAGPGDRPLRLHDPAHFREQLDRWAAQVRGPTVFVVTQFQSVSPEIGRELCVVLRALHQEQWAEGRRGLCSFLLVGALSLDKLARDHTSPLFMVVRVHRIPDLVPDEARSLLRAGFAASQRNVGMDAVDAVVEQLGGDRYLLQCAGERIVACPPAPGGGEIRADDVSRALDRLLRDATWLQDNLVDAFRDHELVLDVVVDLLAGKTPRQREITPDIGQAELSGCLAVERGHYRFRSPFYQALAQRVLQGRSLPDLLLLHGRYVDARARFRETTPEALGGPSVVPPAEVAHALGVEVLGLSAPEEILERACDVLELAFGLAEARAYRVVGRAPEHFENLRGDPPPLQEREIQLLWKVRSGQRRRSEWTPLGRTVALPLLRRSDRSKDVRWIVLLREDGRRKGTPLPGVDAFLLVVEQAVALQGRLAEERHISTITAQIAGAQGTRAVLASVLRAALELTDAPFGNILRPKPAEADKLVVEVQIGTKGGPVRRGDPDRVQVARAFHPDCGVAGYVFDKGETRIIGHRKEGVLPRGTPRPFRFMPWIRGTVSEVAVPIPPDGPRLGVLNVEHRAPFYFDGGHVELLEQLARFAAIALRNATALDRAEAEALLSTTFAGIAHEVRSPASWIQGEAARLLELDDEGRMSPERLRRGLLETREGALKILGIADDFGLLMKVRDVRLRDIDVVAVVEDAKREVAATDALESTDWCRTEVESESDIIIRGHERLLQRAFANLLSNAVEAVRNVRNGAVGPGDVRVSVRRSRRGRILVTVEDEGAGLPRGKDVFEAGYTTKGGRGLGLGLAICRQIVEAHGGRIRGTRRSPHGSRFVVDLPRASRDA